MIGTDIQCRIREMYKRSDLWDLDRKYNTPLIFQLVEKKGEKFTTYLVDSTAVVDSLAEGTVAEDMHMAAVGSLAEGMAAVGGRAVGDMVAVDTVAVGMVAVGTVAVDTQQEEARSLQHQDVVVGHCRVAGHVSL